MMKFSEVMLSTTAISIALAVGVSAPVMAQTAPKAAQTAEPAPVEEIVVTGSRIVREGYESPTPLAVVSEEQLKGSADNNLVAYLATQPVFTGNSTTKNNITAGASGSVGVNTLNLRGLGNRTLVLLDGRRLEPATAAGAVDISSLPQQLISRVDVITGGASAVYGSDAVAGVVNFVLDKNFTGIKGELSGGLTNYGDGKNYNIDLAAGTGFADNRGHILLSGSMFHADLIPGNARPWAKEGGQVLTNPAYTATNGQPANLFVNHAAYATGTPGGIILSSTGTLINSGPLARIAFGVNGVPYSVGSYGDIVGTNGIAQGGAWQTNDMRTVEPISTEEARENLFGNVSYDITDNISAYVQYSWSHASGFTPVGPVFRQGGSAVTITIDNPFIPASVRTAMTAAGATSIRVGTFNQDLGIVNLESDRWSRRYIAGLQGKFDAFGSPWNWNASYQRGEAKITQSIPTNISLANYFAAIDVVANPVTGVPQCRSLATNPACVPWNVMGTDVNDPNGAASRFIHHRSLSFEKITQNIFAASVTGEPFSLPAGPVSVAADVEHRSNSINMSRDALSATAGNLFNNSPLIVGSTKVTEGAMETVIPLFKGLSWVDNWDVTGAARYTSYNIAGNVFTWKVGSTFSPVPDIKLRVTRSRDINAPNATQNFDTGTVTRSNTPDLKYNTTPIVTVTNKGNLTLKPENADNFSAGIVLQPSFLDGFSVSADYWTINIHDVINSLSAQNVIAYCYNGTRPDLCANVTRDPTTDQVTAVSTGQFNFAFQKTRGLDLEASYRTSLDSLGVPGQLALHGNMTFYFEQRVDTGLVGVVPIDYAGENGSNNLPNWRLNTTISYDLEPVKVALTARAFPSGKKYANYIGCTSGCPTNTAANPTINDNTLPGAFYLDMSVNYDVEVGSASGTVFLNVKNLMDRDPPLTNGTIFFAPPTNTYLYDTSGRVFRAGIRFKM